MTRPWADYPHIRIYSSIFEDDKFLTVRDDNAAFAWYVRLLFIAHAAHPAPGYLPRRVPRKVLATLQDAGLIALDGPRFTMSGVAIERAEVADLAHRAGGTVRAATAERDESGRFIPSIPLDSAGPAVSHVFAREDESVLNEDGREDVEAFVFVRRRAPSPKQRQVLDDCLQYHPASWAADLITRHPQDPIGAVIEAQKQWRASRKAEIVAEEQHYESEKKRRRQEAEGWMADWKRIQQEKCDHKVGDHGTCERCGLTGLTQSDSREKIEAA